MQNFIRAALAGAFLIAISGSVQAADLDCSPWAYTEDGGYEGGEIEAYITCYAPGGIIPAGLSLGCPMREGAAASLKAYPLDDVFQPDGAPVTYTVGAHSVTLDAIFQAADGSFFANGQADLLALLAGADAVVVAIEGAGEAMTLPLAGAAEVIARMQAACGAD